MLFTNLNVKSHYSLLNSTLKVSDIINHALENQFSYVSLVDQASFSGALEFLVKAKSVKLNAIIGLEFNVVDKDYEYSIIAYALNTKGFKNLEKISSQIMMSKDKTIDYQDLSKLQDNLIFVVDILSSKIYYDYLLNEELNLEYLAYLKLTYPNFYYFYNLRNDTRFIKLFSSNYHSNLEIVASSINYKLQDDASLHYMLNCLRDSKLADKLILERKGHHHLITKDNLVSINQDVLINTSNFIKQFSEIEIVSTKTLPLYKEDTSSIDTYLKKLCFKGLSKRLNTENIAQDYLQRLYYELDIVKQMGFSNYFLVVYDYVLYAKKNNILVGPGRGSSAGSLIAYTLGITNVDPIKNNLIFERFLNPERINLPDIDVDFQDDKRELVIEYLKDKYSHSNIAHIITYGTFQAKNSLRDLARVLAIPNYRLDLILKQIPNVLNVKLKSLLEESKAIQVVLQANSDLEYLYHQAIKLESINRHASSHAAGIIISNKPLIEYAPVMNGLNDTLMIQYSMDYIEKLNLYKMDILGLKNLSIISEILSDIKAEIDLNKIDLEDQKTFKLVASGNTLGVFQFESAGVIKVLRKMAPDNLNDMVATTALFRPGPMQYIDEYIARKNKKSKIDYVHDDLKDILKETYGIIVYQEQIMQICQKMAGFSLAKADIVRKGMAKKDKKLLDEIKSDFVENSLKNGYTLEVANKVYNMILLFSNYGFNKAHAYSYALLGYYLAYLKTNYPQEFYKNILSANIYSLNKLKQYLFELKQLKMNIIVPNINKSTLKFEYQATNFVLPLISIKGLGENNANLIIEERINNNEYLDYYDCLVRLKKNGISSNIISNLIYAGAFDCFEYNRKTMIENLAHFESYIELTRVNEKQISFELESIPKPKIVKHAFDATLFDYELDLLGLYLSNHPLDKYLSTYPNNSFALLDQHNSALALIESIKEIRTKKGELMAFVSVNDLLDIKTLVVFPNLYKKYQSKLQVKSIVLISGEVDSKDNTNIILKSIEFL